MSDKTKIVNPKAQVTLYTRPGCHLCDEAKQQMLAANCPELYDLHEVNIDLDPTLTELYGLQIPVIAINGREAFKYRVTPEAFRNALHGRDADGEIQ